MSHSIRIRLFLMMGLQFFIWGCWLPLVYSYLPSLGFTPAQQSWILNAFPMAAVVGLFFSNQYADRHFAAERFFGFSHLVGGAAMLLLAFTKSFWPFFGLMWLHCLFYVPTVSIVNSIIFAHLKDPAKEYGLTRVGACAGWVLAAWPFTFILVDWDKVQAAHPHGLASWLGTVLGSGLAGAALQQATRWTFIVAGSASLLLAAWSLVLPHTPPKKVRRGADRFAWLEAFRLLKQPFVLVLWLVAAVDSFVLYSYFNWTGIFLAAKATEGGVGIPGNWIMPVMSVGQISEMLTMFILGPVLKRLGWRRTMLIGILGHSARFAVYAFFPNPATIVLVQSLHGICYGFFFATVYIFVDEYFPKDVRACAQGLFNAVILGVGALAANSLCPYLMQKVFTQGERTNFRGLFLVPLAIATLAALVLALFFHPPIRRQAAPALQAVAGAENVSP
jgi:MFS family permease